MEQSESKTIISAQSKTNKTVSEAEEKKIVAQMSTVGIAGNVLLSAFKLIAGLAGSSGAMISDAVHSLSDVLATFIAMIGVRISKRGADADHQYGHEKFECISSEILAGILFVTGLGIGSVGVEKIIGGHYEDLTVPGDASADCGNCFDCIERSNVLVYACLCEKDSVIGFYGRCHGITAQMHFLPSVR